MRAGEEKEIRVKSRLPGSSFSPETKTTFSLPARFSPLKHDENEQTLLVLTNLHTVPHIERGRLYHPQHQWGRYRVRGAKEKKNVWEKASPTFLHRFFFVLHFARACKHLAAAKGLFSASLSLSLCHFIPLHLFDIRIDGKAISLPTFWDAVNGL